MTDIHLLSNNDLDHLVVASDRERTLMKNGGSVLDVVCMADVQPKAIEWLWPNWLAIGKVAILAGEGGRGKSTVICDLAARTTTGDVWPDFARGDGKGGSVIMLTAEDGVEDTLAPRLIAAGADRARVFNVRSVRDANGRRGFNLQADLASLEAEIEAHPDARFVTIDPISSYLGKVDSHKNAEVRSVLEPLGEMAERRRVAILCNNHFSKGGGGANERMIGSVAFINYARSGSIVTPDAEDESRLLMIPSKMNIAPIKYGLAYRIGSRAVAGADGSDIITSSIYWESEPVKISANEALAAVSAGDDGRTAKAEALDFLQAALASGALPVATVQQLAREAGITPKSLRGAKDTLGIRPQRYGGLGKEGAWKWELPA